MKMLIVSTSVVVLAAGCVLWAARDGFRQAEPTIVAAPAAFQDSGEAGAEGGHAYDLDSVHSSVIFRVKHLGVSNFFGRFNEVQGEYTFDPDNPSGASIQVTVATESVDTNNDGRDNHLRSPDFFNAREFPQLTFKSTAIEKTGEGTYSLTGDLSMHGVTRPITTTLAWNGAGDRGARMGYRSGFDVNFTVKRTDYGMDEYVENGMLGDEVNIWVGIEGIRR